MDYCCFVEFNKVLSDAALYTIGNPSLHINRFDKKRKDLYSGATVTSKLRASRRLVTSICSDFRSAEDFEHNLADGVVAALQDDNRSATTSGTEDDELCKITDMLSSILPPRICDVASRQAVVTWTPFDCSEASASGGPFPQIDASEFTYQVLLSLFCFHMQRVFSGVAV